MMTSDEILALYDRRRAVSRPMSDEMFRRADRATMQETARKLGILHRGTMVFDSETELSVLSDACVFEAWAHGENIVMRALRTSPPPPGSAEREILEACCKARFSIYQALRTVPRVGVYVRDLLREGDEILVVDRGLSLSGEAFVFAGRLVFFPEFAITTGAGIPIAGRAALRSVVETLSRRFGVLRMPEIDQAPDGARADLFFLVVRTLLAMHQTRYVEYADSPEQLGPSQLGSMALPAPRSGPAVRERSLPRVGRNEPCPCGSGRKYKKCHGA